MRLLIISPDYLSHFLPMSAIAAAWKADGGDLTVATGRSIRDHVQAAGLDWRELRMSRGSNAGISGDGSPDDDLRPFFAATRLGMVPTLRYQADQRDTDLLWEPETVARATIDVVDEVAPDAIVVDHLAFAATLGLRAAAIPFTSFVPGHPTQLPVNDEVYGHPTRWPSAISAPPDELAELRRCCTGVTARFTDRYNAVVQQLAPSTPTVDDAFRVHGDDVLFNSAPALADPARTLPMRHALLGSCVRPERPDRRTEHWLAADEPFVYVSFGTFLSRRDDVLASVVATLRERDVRVALATGAARFNVLGPLPSSWLVAPSLPQVALLARAAAAVTHGGNNSVTECLTAGVPMVVLPLSTDQFAIAADLEDVEAATAIDPNAPCRDRLHDALDETLGAVRQGVVHRIADQLRARPGPTIALQRLRLDAHVASTSVPRIVGPPDIRVEPCSVEKVNVGSACRRHA
jgi:MGT family glycosyltransferase